MKILLFIMIALSHTLFGLFGARNKYHKAISWVIYIIYFGAFIAACFLPFPIWFIYLITYSVYVVIFLILSKDKFIKSLFLLTSYTVMFTIFFSLTLSLELIPEKLIGLRWTLIIISYLGIESLLYLVLVPIYRKTESIMTKTSKWVQFFCGNCIFFALLFTQTIWPFSINKENPVRVVIFILSALAYFFTFHLVFYNFVNESIIKENIEENVHLAEMAYTDSLTSLLNKTSYDAHIHDLTENGSMTDDIIIVVMDINKFKSINDKYGHLKGDAVLKEVGESILNIFSDDPFTVFRIGGDEFAVITKNSSDEVVEELIKSLNDCLIKKHKVTVSAGYAHVNYENINPFRTAFKNADKNMYKAKYQR